jgi:thiamine kinase-like enzyme
MNFWEFVTQTTGEWNPQATGRTLKSCHELLRTFATPLPKLGIMTETLTILETRELFPATTQRMLHDRLSSSMHALKDFPAQPLHGDAHMGNLINTSRGLLLTDWEDAFFGPVEWDVASLIWNAKILDGDDDTVSAILGAYGQVNSEALQQSMVARAAVITAWYPILYPKPNEERQAKLRHRIEWLESGDATKTFAS